MSRDWQSKLPLAPFGAILKELTNMKISSSANEALREVISEVIEELALDATEFAKNANRITIKDRDIYSAYKNWRKRR
ncbi:MAG: hypothetical protein FK731_02240 [Asgard group archaeon]|nr:hypothetical protein [Asgard group archaeon]